MYFVFVRIGIIFSPEVAEDDIGIIFMPAVTDDNKGINKCLWISLLLLSLLVSKTLYVRLKDLSQFIIVEVPSCVEEWSAIEMILVTAQRAQVI